MPTMDDARGANWGLFATVCAYLELVSWCTIEDSPDGENTWPMPFTSWSATFHIVDRAAPGLPSTETDLVAYPPVVKPR